MTRCLMIGPGAIGLTIGVGLLDNGLDVDFASRSEFDRLHYTGPDSARSYDVNVLTNPSGVGHYDVVFLAAKAHQTEGASGWLRNAVFSESIVVVLQNGIEHRQRVAPFIPEDAEVVPGVIYTPSERTEPGVVTNTGQARLVFPDDLPSRQVGELFDGSFVEIKLHDDWHTAAWTKLLMNAAGGIISCLTQRPMSAYSDEGAAGLLLDLLAEGASVARADGANIPDELVAKIHHGMTTSTVSHIPSIAADRIAGRPTEWRARNQIVVDLGDKYSVPVPLNRAGTTLIRLGEPQG